MGLPKGREVLLGLLLFFIALVRWGLENFWGDGRISLSCMEFSPPFWGLGEYYWPLRGDDFLAGEMWLIGGDPFEPLFL
jgi:hypothetical protein